MKINKLALAALCASSGVASASTVYNFDNVDYGTSTGTYASSATVTAVNDYRLHSYTVTGDIDGLGIADDTLTFSFRERIYDATTYDGSTLTLGDLLDISTSTEATLGGGLLTSGNAIYLVVNQVSLTRGETDAITSDVSFDGFTNVTSLGATDATWLYGNDVSSLTSTTTPAAGVFSGESGFYIALQDDNGLDGVRLRWADLQFTVSNDLVPEPSSTALLGLGGLALLIRRKR